MNRNEVYFDLNSKNDDKYLSEAQIKKLKGKYNFQNMTPAEEEGFLRELYDMGILTQEDCNCYSKAGGNIVETLTNRVSTDINLLYRMAIAGRHSDSHIENIKREQRILGVLEQLTAG